MKHSNPEFLKAFGENLRRIREGKKLGLREFAAEADLEFSYVSKIERGGANPTLELIYHLAQSLGISHQELFAFKMPSKGRK